MLCNLVVENYALISKLEIEFRNGLTIITGETGAGKSILLGALSLILGKRADTSVLYDKEKKCIVEGTFNISHYGLAVFFENKGVDYDDETVIRREISSSGKSRAFINDVPVNLELLTELGNRLLDIHSQHQNLNLADSIFQMKVLDSYSKSQNLLDEYKSYFTNFREIKQDHQKLVEEASRSKTDLDYYQFQLTQLEEAHLIDGEKEELETELEKLTHAEEIKTSLQNAYSILQGETDSTLQQLKDCYTSIHRIVKYLHGKENLSERIDSAYIEIKDIAHEIEVINSSVSYDPERLEQINDRLNILNNLEKKHHLSTTAELILLRDQLKVKVNEINSYDYQLAELEKKLTESFNQLDQKASLLSQHRQKAIASFEKKVIELLTEVGILNAGFAIVLEKINDFTQNGNDRIQFLFSANKDARLQDIAKVASGGEISRLMLCIKSLLSDSTGLPTIIFDEIDTGVSGEIAEKVGNIIFRMSDRMQILNITHLPQVASKGANHYLVYKTIENNTSVTRMKLLNQQERLVEIAKMLSGEEVTSAAMENARSLLGLI